MAEQFLHRQLNKEIKSLEKKVRQLMARLEKIETPKAHKSIFLAWFPNTQRFDNLLEKMWDVKPSGKEVTRKALELQRLDGRSGIEVREVITVPVDYSNEETGTPGTLTGQQHEEK